VLKSFSIFDETGCAKYNHTNFDRQKYRKRGIAATVELPYLCSENKTTIMMREELSE
jgi:hypothetical protein